MSFDCKESVCVSRRLNCNPKWIPLFSMFLSLQFGRDLDFSWVVRSVV